MTATTAKRASVRNCTTPWPAGLVEIRSGGETAKVAMIAKQNLFKISALRPLRSLRFLSLLVFLSAVGLSAVGCGGDREAAETSTSLAVPKDAITKTTDHGPVKATVALWPAKPNLGETIFVRLAVEAPQGVQIEAPFQEAGDSRLGRFRVVGFVRDVKHEGTKTVHEQTYTLEAPSSGRHRVPPLRLEMIDGRAGASAEGAKAQEVLTDEVPVEVAPVPAEQASKALAAAYGELPTTVGGTSWVVVLGIVGGAIAIGVGGFFAWRSMRLRRRVQKQRSAYEDAVIALRALEERGAPDAVAADAWFVELSSIVRHYLENRYEIRAPELTTEEFLNVATARAELTTEHRGLLTSFLERCDRVKFAGYRPEADESIATLAAARGFVEDTRLREVAA